MIEEYFQYPVLVIKMKKKTMKGRLRHKYTEVAGLTDLMVFKKCKLHFKC